MNETAAQANHELLLGLSRSAKTATDALQYLSKQLTTISQQLLDLNRATSPALGLCGSHVAEWIDAGADPNAAIPSAQTTIVLQGIGVVPVCLQHFRALKAAVSGPQLLVAQPGTPQPPSDGLIVPGRF